jgi:hypothetical protein
MTARAKLGGDRGVALPLALAVLFTTGGLATLAAREAIFSSSQTLRDQTVKRAAHAATAGIEAGIFRMNRMQPGPQECVVKSGSGGSLAVADLAADGWCAPQTEDLGNGSSFSVRVSGVTTVSANGQMLAERRMVSTGIAGSTTRRVRVTMNAATGAPVFAQGYAAVSLATVDYGNNVRITGGLGSNGNIYLKNSAQVCGAATPGPGKRLFIRNAASVCPTHSTAAAQTSFNLQPVDQGDAPANNDNARIGNPPQPTSLDPCTDCDGIDWDPSTRMLRLRNNSTLTLGGSVYSFCGIELENTAQLKIPVRPLGTGLRLFVDAPESCGGEGTGSVSVRNSATILNLNADPTTFQLYLIGSSAISTVVAFDGVDLAQNLVMAVYAPYSTIRIKGDTTLSGAIASKSIDLQNSARIDYHERIADITTGSPLRLYRPEHYLECTSTPPGSEPDSGC